MGTTEHNPTLSERERQLLTLAAQGYTDQAIANRLGISLATVGTYWGRIRIKLGPLNRTELVANHLREQAGATVERLRSENRHLLAEIDQHLNVERELQSTLHLMRELLENAPDAIIVIDSNSHIRMVNRAAETMFGYSAEELQLLTVGDLVPTQYRIEHEVIHREYMGHPERKQMGGHNGTLALGKDGRQFPIAATLSSVDNAHGLLVICVIREIELTAITGA